MSTFGWHPTKLWINHVFYFYYMVKLLNFRQVIALVLQINNFNVFFTKFTESLNIQNNQSSSRLFNFQILIFKHLDPLSVCFLKDPTVSLF